MAHSKENKPTETVPDKDLMAYILDTEVKINNCLKDRQLKEDVEKVAKTIYEQNGNINKEIENLRRCQKEILELKSTKTQMKNSLEGFKDRFEQAERISKLEDRTTEIIQSED